MRPHDELERLDEPVAPPTSEATVAEVPAPAHEPGDGRPVWDPRVGAWVSPDELTPVFPRVTSRRKRGPSPVWRAALAGGLIGALISSLMTVGIVRSFPAAPPVVERRLDTPVSPQRAGQASIVDIAERARPWVTNINITGQREGALGTQVVRGTGTGVILRSDGHIITNQHVVAGATDIRVTLASGEELAAERVGEDADTDIAVIRVNREDLPPAVIGSARDLRVGELAVAIGSPLGLEQTVTSGIISALGRRVARPGQPPLVDMIQTDTPITQGNSGGPLINGEGAVIGINTAIAASPDVGAEGIAFAIPIDIAAAVAGELIETGRATHPWLGISGGNITPETARQFGISAGALVIEVVPGSPAEEAGLTPQDVIVRFDGERIESMDELIVAIRERQVGDTVTLDVVRDGERISMQARLGDKPEGL